MQGNLGSELLIEAIGNPIAAADDIEEDSAAIDMANYQGILFIAPISESAAGAVARLAVLTCETDDGEFVEVAEAEAVAEEEGDLDNLLLTVNLYKPVDRYVMASRRSATANIAFGHLISEKYGGRKSPAPDAATVAAETNM